MEDVKFATAVADAADAKKNTNAGKPVARMSLVIDLDRVLDTTAQKELLDTVALYGKVTKATHKVLRAHSTELV